jgi:hypothetical protein
MAYSSQSMTCVYACEYALTGLVFKLNKSGNGTNNAMAPIGSIR